MHVSSRCPHCIARFITDEDNLNLQFINISTKLNGLGVKSWSWEHGFESCSWQAFFKKWLLVQTYRNCNLIVSSVGGCNIGDKCIGIPINDTHDFYNESVSGDISGTLVGTDSGGRTFHWKLQCKVRTPESGLARVPNIPPGVIVATAPRTIQK